MARRRRSRLALRSLDARRLLDAFLVCAISGVLLNRGFLAATGYPQVGNGTLHISHALWGALMMAIALSAAIAYVGPSTRVLVALLGGFGFGWFVDELGKFITRDVDYFFRPTIALIYLVFVGFYLAFRVVERTNLTADEAVCNGLEALKAAATGELAESRRDEVLALLDATGTPTAIATQVRSLLADAPTHPPREPGRLARWGEALRAWYLRVSGKRRFVITVGAFFLVEGLGRLVALIVLAFDDRAVSGAAEWTSIVSGTVSALLFVVGVALLPRARVAGYRWIESGVLVDLFVTQVVVFEEVELAGLTSLAVNLVLWVLLRTAARAEGERDPRGGQEVRERRP